MSYFYFVWVGKREAGGREGEIHRAEGSGATVQGFRKGNNKHNKKN